MGPQHDSCGRRACAFLVRRAPAPSMGPQHDSCGRRYAGRPAAVPVRPSMGPQHDSCGRPPGDFGGGIAGILQWGRNMIVAEGRVTPKEPVRAPNLQWGRNMIVAEGCSTDSASRPCQPSMGPQHDSCGRNRDPPTFSSPWANLQWGRNMIVAEGSKSCGPSLLRLLLQWGRNMIVAEGSRHRQLCVWISPSMGPQHDSCGRVGRVGHVPHRASLQWGRNMIVAEGLWFWMGLCYSMSLQWGRNMIVAEGDCARRDPRGALAPSMGPQHDSCGRVKARKAMAGGAAILQWGRNMIVAEGLRASLPSA